MRPSICINARFGPYVKSSKNLFEHARDNPTITSYCSRAVKIYSSSSSLVRFFEAKKIVFLYLKKCSGVVVVTSEVVGLVDQLKRSSNSVLRINEPLKREYNFFRSKLTEKNVPAIIHTLDFLR
jgi:hypothetical protein